jgi:ADP-ribose pyrophosphatase YjhB (NUDIX family)
MSTTLSRPDDDDDDDDDDENHSSIDNIRVGVCIFRLDSQTLWPAVLLLRRSPDWWQQQRHLSTSEGERVEDWELPGGKVRENDFCISSAIERLVREQTGLRVTKIMEMLQDIRWTTEVKVLLWDEDDDDDDDDDDNDDDEEEEDDNRGHGERKSVRVKIGMRPSVDGTMALEREREEQGCSRMTGDTLAHFLEKGVANSSSGSSFMLPRADSSLNPPPLPLPRYDDDDHDPSLEPAPLTLPSRSASRANPILPHRRPNLDALLQRRRHIPAASGSTSAATRPGRDRRHAQIIPYKMLQKSCLQLNFLVLVDEDPGEEDEEDMPVPAFLLQHTSTSTTDSNKKEAGVAVHEHDALEWTTYSRARGLPMNEDLRRVVCRGLVWAGAAARGIV